MASAIFAKQASSLEGFKGEASRIVGEWNVLESRLGYVPAGTFELFRDHNPALTQARQYLSGLEAIRQVLSSKYGDSGADAARHYDPVIKQMKSRIADVLTAPYVAPGPSDNPGVKPGKKGVPLELA